MKEWWEAIAYALVTAFLGVVLSELGFKGARLVGLLGTVSLIGACALYIGDLLELLPYVGGENREYAVAMLKIVGVGYAFGICADVCSELGQGGIGNAICLFGKMEILMLSMPFVKRIVEKGVELL